MPTTPHNLEKGEKLGQGVEAEAIERLWATMNQSTANVAITASYDVCCQYATNQALLATNQALLENQAAVDAAEGVGNVEGAGSGSES